MYKIIKENIVGIKCDHCDWSDMSFEWIDINATIKEYLNKPCPKCGHSLLTKSDAYNVLKISNAVNKINKFLNKILPNFVLKWLETKPSDCVDIKMNGTGTIKMEAIKK